MIQAKGVSLIYHDHGREVFACREVDFDLVDGEFVGILGPSGSGKSSLLYLLSGLKNPTRGTITVKGRDLADMDDHARALLRLTSFGFVFQQPYLLGYLTALENVMSVSSQPIGRAQDLLADLGLAEKLGRFPHELSGGERQRVCVARALINDPEVIFADEPTAALDHTNGELVVDMINRHRKQGSLIMVTHDPGMLASADRTLLMNDGTIAGM